MDETINIPKVATFEKVSKEEWMKNTPRLPEKWINANEKNKKAYEEILEKYESAYDSIILPKRATTGSAGYDFFLPFTGISLAPGMVATISTGIKCKIQPGWFLALFPRSGHGFKYRISLANTVGIIDSDYYNCESNEGHIMVKLCNNLDVEGVPIKMVNDIVSGKQIAKLDTDSEEFRSRCLILDPGKAFCQGIFLPYGITTDDETGGERVGGIGSTNTSN